MKLPPPLVWILGLAFLSLGFDLENAAIPVKEIQDGGVPVDGIPALDHPDWVSREDAEDFLEPKDWVVGLVQGETIRAYPFRILNWHEVVNDSIAGTDVVVTYCPLTRSALVFESTAGGKLLHFGVSGKLYKSNLLFYDRETKSLWSQILGKAVTGPMKGTVLRSLPVVVTTWGLWKIKYPATQVLSLDTGFFRNYSGNPYAGYEGSESFLFPMGEIRKELPAKAWVLGVKFHEKTKAYPLEVLNKEKSKRLKDGIGDEKVFVERDPDLEDYEVQDAEGNLLPAFRIYWFAWQALYPETEVYSRA